MSTRLGRPLAVFTATALCDRENHEVTIYTDGLRASLDWDGMGNDRGVARDHTTLSAPCPVDVSGEDCPGYVEWRFTDDGWTSDRQAIETLLTYGRKVDQP